MTEPAEKKNQPPKKKNLREFNNHPMCQHFLCWLNSWMLLVKESRNCLTRLNLWTLVSGTLLAASASAGAGPCSPLTAGITFAAEKKGREMFLLTSCGISFWPEAQVGYSQSIFACPAPDAVNEHEAPQSSAKWNQSFPQCVSQPATAASPKEL